MSAANKDKHGIDFQEAQALWEDGDLVEVPSSQLGEERFLAVGMLNGKHWSAICTWGDGRIRRISVRRSREREVNVDFPTWVVRALDAEAQRLGVTRQALIKLWIAERLPQR